MSSPYQGLSPTKYWKTGVAESTPQTIQGLYTKKFTLTPNIATAGSCFAQHIARNLRLNGFSVLDAEPAPEGLANERAQEYGFNMYSARYGNIYVARQLLQLILEANSEFTPENVVWEKDGRYFDALRPSVEPNGHATPEAVLRHRQDHLKSVKWLFDHVETLVFTFGLTEGWVHDSSGTVYPTAPGTIAGDIKGSGVSFKNFTFSEIKDDFLAARERLKAIRPDMKFLLTVSPVPLTATMSSEHVLAATTYSKSVLRAVAGELYQTYDDIDYFPSYEIITGALSKGAFYEKNMRSVTADGVATVMRTFFAEHPPLIADKAKKKQSKEDVQCEDALLEAFA